MTLPEPTTQDLDTAGHPEEHREEHSLDELIAAARRARDIAHVPYSGFAMGAAVRTTTGEVIAGSLVENVSLGLAMCAERVAMFSCVSLGLRPAQLVLVSPRTDGQLTHSCGACLQVGLELGGPDLDVVAVDLDGHHSRHQLGDLLPHGPRKSDRR